MRHHKINIKAISSACPFGQKHLTSLSISFHFKLRIIQLHKVTIIKTLYRLYLKSILEIVRKEKSEMIPMFLARLLVHDGVLHWNPDPRQGAGFKEQVMNFILGILNLRVKRLQSRRAQSNVIHKAQTFTGLI